MNFRFLAILTLFLHLLLFVLLSESLRTDPHCLSTEIISEMRLVRLQGQAQVRTCSRGFLALFTDPKVHSDLWPFIRRINKLKIFEGLLPFPKDPLVLRLTLGEAPDLRLLGNLAELSESEAQLEGKLEKLVLMSWLKQLVPLAEEDHLNWEIVAEALLRLNGPHRIQRQDWLSGLMSFREYCTSKQRSFQHAQFCEHKIKSDASDLKYPSIWGFRESLAQEMSLRLSQLTPADLRRILLNPKLYKLQFTDPQTLPQDYSSLASFKLWWLHQVQVLDQVFGLAAKDPLQELDKPEIDILVDLVEGPAGQLRKNLIQSVELGGLNERALGLVEEGELVNLKSKKRTGFWAEGVRTNLYVMLRCGVPHLEEVLDLKAEKFLFIDHCEEKNLSWNLLLLGGLQSFLSQHSSLAHVLIHLPSLRKVALQADRSEDLQALIDRIPLIWDGKHQSYKSQLEWPLLLSLRGLGFSKSN